jgi:hypothetical protein
MRLLGALESELNPERTIAMPQTNVIPSGNTLASSDWVTLDASGICGFLLRGASGTVLIEQRAADNSPEVIGDLNTSRYMGKSTQVYGPGTYRVTRPVQADNVAVDQIT